MTEPVVTHAPGTPKLLLGSYDIADLGYIDDEYFVAGTACAYAPVERLGADGHWTAAPSGSAEYTIRIVVLKPADAAQVNGTAVVEWLNVSGGGGAAPVRTKGPTMWPSGPRPVIRRFDAPVDCWPVSGAAVPADAKKGRGASKSLMS